MCGLCGILGPGIVKPDLDSLKALVYVSALRGHQGTGILQAKVRTWKTGTDVNYMIQKDVMSSGYWLWYHEYAKEGNRKVGQDQTNNLFAAHVRQATMGKICKENTHPFEFDNIIGMHNGTLKDKKYQSDNDEKTDSELLLKDINERGIKPVLEELDPDSAYALVIFNKNTGDVSFVNNGKREIYFGLNKQRGVLYWASEPDMINLACNRNRISLIDDEVIKFSPHKIYTLSPDDLRANEKKIWEITEITPKQKEVTTGYGSPRWGGLPFVPVNQNEKGSEEKDKPKENKNSKPRVRIRNLKDRIPIIKCCACHKTLTPVEAFFGLEISYNTYVCTDCQADEEALKHIQVETEVKVG